MIVAEELGVDLDRIRIENADTGTTSYAPVAGGSQTVIINGPAVRQAALDVKRQLLEMAGRQLGLPPESLVLKGATIEAREGGRSVAIRELQELQRDKAVVGVGRRHPKPKGKVSLPFVVHFAEVEVDTRTGESRVLRLLGAHDSGRVMNALTYENQVFGGMVMGIGFGMTEERVIDRNTGQVTTTNWHDYKLPTIKDVPPEMTCLPIDPHDTEGNTVGREGSRRAGHHPDGGRHRQRVPPRDRRPGHGDPDQPHAPGRAPGQGGEVSMLPSFAYTRPASLDDAAKALAEDRAHALAGGTDLLGCLRDQVFEAQTLVSLGGLRELRGIAETAEGGLRIGALTTIAEIAEHDAVRRATPPSPRRPPR